MRYPNFLHGARVVFSTRKQRGPPWQAPGEKPGLYARGGALAHIFIVQCRKSQRPRCMADTTGPMPLIWWRREGKRRLRLALPASGVDAALSQACADAVDGLLEESLRVSFWARGQRPRTGFSGVAERPFDAVPGQRGQIGNAGWRRYPAGESWLIGQRGGHHHEDQCHPFPSPQRGRTMPLRAPSNCRLTPTKSTLPNLEGGGCPCAYPLSVLRMPATWRLPILASLQPISRSTWVVCSPRSGVGTPAEGRVSPNCTSCQATRSVPAFAC
jgi:hypothetical protein